MHASNHSATSHTYKIIEVVGTSPESSDHAIRHALAEASKTVQHIDWFEVTGCRGHVEAGQVKHFQVMLKLGFRVQS